MTTRPLALRAPRWVLTLTLASLLASAGFGEACGTNSGSSSIPDAGADQDLLGPSPARCPAERPTGGTACTLPEGTACAFGTCDGFATCTRGAWRIATNPPPNPPCPALVPEEGQACPPCFGATVCTYNDLTCTDAAANAARATCARGTFTVTLVTCVEAGISDAGLDAQDAQDARDARDARDGP